jgi:hypothetical protein
MGRMSREEFERQAVLYAMGALAPEEARRFELERARRGGEGETLARGVGQAIGQGGVTRSERAALAAVTTAPARRVPWPWFALSLVLLAAGIGVAVWGLEEHGRAERAATRAAGQQAARDSLDRVLERTQLELAGQPRAAELAPLLAAGDLAVVPLAGAGGAEGRIVASAGGALFVASGLPGLPAGGTYQLWRRAGALVEPVAALGDAPQDFLFALFTDAGFLTGAQTLFVSAEAGPGATVPGGAPVLEGRVP